MLLPVIVAAVIVFVAVLVMLGCAAVSERNQLERIGFDPSAEPFPLSYTEAFDPDHAVLWTTQIPALQLICDAGERGMRYDHLQREYLRSERRFPELYEGSSFAQWLFSLQRAELIVMSSRRVKITPLGGTFLEYCLREVALAA